MTITEFLLARIAEDEAVARTATPGPWSTMTEETGDGENIYYTVEHGRGQLLDMTDTSIRGWRDSDHIARHDPARVLAECAAKRAIVKVHQTVHVAPGRSDTTCAGCGDAFNSRPCPTLAHLAAVYADHPDYQQEWAL